MVTSSDRPAQSIATENWDGGGVAKWRIGVARKKRDRISFPPIIGIDNALAFDDGKEILSLFCGLAAKQPFRNSLGTAGGWDFSRSKGKTTWERGRLARGDNGNENENEGDLLIERDYSQR